jgi:pimeloyl-ACP methyl ester carboxylesterase
MYSSNHVGPNRQNGRRVVSWFEKKHGDDGSRLMTQSVAAAWNGIIAAGSDISRSRAADIVCPVRLIVGETDTFAPPELVADMAGAIPRGESIAVSGAGHGVHHSHQEWLISKTTDWLGVG